MSEQFQLFMDYESKRKIKIIRVDLNSKRTDLESTSFSDLTYPFDGVVGFLPSKNNNTILVCMNYIKIQKCYIKNDKDKDLFEVIEKDSFLLPENLFKELENSKDSKRNWNYLLKSRYREFLITDKSYNQQIQHIEIYNINTSQLVNFFYKNREKSEKSEKNNLNNENESEISIISIDSDLFDLNRIFAISTDSDLFAYSYGDNTITIYLMESGLEVVSKTFDGIIKIEFLEFIEDNKELFIIGEGKNNNMEFHIWLLTGCLDDHFIIKHNISDYGRRTLKYANGALIFLDDNKNIKIIHEYTKEIIKSSSKNFSDKSFERFKELYLKIKDISKPKLDDVMTNNTINIACGLLVYLYNSRNDRKKIIDSNHQELVSVTLKFIKTFIEKHPDNWKLMEIQYPLMALLIYARSFSLIKFILFDENSKAKNLHRPRSQYAFYPNYYEGLKLSKSDNDLKLALSLCKG
jgi:hypothetical protein